jgi:hypothetical protein
MSFISDVATEVYLFINTLSSRSYTERLIRYYRNYLFINLPKTSILQEATI